MNKEYILLCEKKRDIVVKKLNATTGVIELGYKSSSQQHKTVVLKPRYDLSSKQRHAKLLCTLDKLMNKNLNPIVFSRYVSKHTCDRLPIPLY